MGRRRLLPLLLAVFAAVAAADELDHVRPRLVHRRQLDQPLDPAHGRGVHLDHELVVGDESVEVDVRRDDDFE